MNWKTHKKHAISSSEWNEIEFYSPNMSIDVPQIQRVSKCDASEEFSLARDMPNSEILWNGFYRRSRVWRYTPNQLMVSACFRNVSLFHSTWCRFLFADFCQFSCPNKISIDIEAHLARSNCSVWNNGSFVVLAFDVRLSFMESKKTDTNEVDLNARISIIAFWNLFLFFNEAKWFELKFCTVNF